MIFCSCVKVNKIFLSDSRSFDTLQVYTPLFQHSVQFYNVDAFLIFLASDLLNLPLFKMLLNNT